MPRKRKPPPRPSFWDARALEEFVVSNGFKESHVQRLYRAAFKLAKDEDPAVVATVVADWGPLTTAAAAKGVPVTLLALLPEHFTLSLLKVVNRADSKDDATTKLVLELHDGHRVETVIMDMGGRTTVCVSSQVGCAMGCQFCATGTLGILGDLTAAEITEQVLQAGLVARTQQRQERDNDSNSTTGTTSTSHSWGYPSNVVFMGQGEPLKNYDAVVEALGGFVDVSRFAMQKQHVTVSTVGVVSAMERLTREHPGVSLALSLHAPNDALRGRIVPAARGQSMERLMAALDGHLAACTRHTRSAKGLMVEYVLLEGVNDSEETARELGALLQGKNVMVNLIPYNPNVTADTHGFRPPSPEACRRFGKVVMDNFGLRVRLRQEMGQDIAAACGQLALVTPPAAAASASSASSSAAASASSACATTGSASSSAASAASSAAATGPNPPDIEELAGPGRNATATTSTTTTTTTTGRVRRVRGARGAGNGPVEAAPRGPSAGNDRIAAADTAAREAGTGTKAKGESDDDSGSNERKSSQKGTAGPAGGTEDPGRGHVEFSSAEGRNGTAGIAMTAAVVAAVAAAALFVVGRVSQQQKRGGASWRNAGWR